MGKIFDYDGVPVLHTTSGDLKGYFYDGVYIYKGIPYAYADRFQMPVPSKWDGVKDATNYGFVCPLQNQDTPNGELMVPHRYWPQDEHCQSLNIWTNKLDPEAKKPVLVWFHGGGYAAGSSIEQVAYDGVSIAKKGDSILVSVNHRLNILGYLDLSPFGEKYKNSANAGHADMVAALQWVHDNIALFGGDPENVTIFGQSGGGMKVTDLMQIPSWDLQDHKPELHFHAAHRISRHKIGRCNVHLFLIPHTQTINSGMFEITSNDGNHPDIFRHARNLWLQAADAP